MENIVSLYTSKYCTTWMCWVEELIYNDQIVLQLHRSKQSSLGICQQWHTAVLMRPSYFIYQHKYQQTYKIMGCFDTGKLSDSGSEKRLDSCRNLVELCTPSYKLGIHVYCNTYLYTTGCFKTISIIAHSSSTARHYWTILSTIIKITGTFTETLCLLWELPYKTCSYRHFLNLYCGGNQTVFWPPGSVYNITTTRLRSNIDPNIPERLLRP
jgi:hypothetical protein